MNCELRTRKSFKNRKQPDHHVKDEKCILLKLKKFDLVCDVVLDSMHLLYLGVQKSILEKLLVVTKHSARLKKSKTEI